MRKSCSTSTRRSRIREREDSRDGQGQGRNSRGSFTGARAGAGRHFQKHQVSRPHPDVSSDHARRVEAVCFSLSSGCGSPDQTPASAARRVHVIGRYFGTKVPIVSPVEGSRTGTRSPVVAQKRSYNTWEPSGSRAIQRRLATLGLPLRTGFRADGRQAFFGRTRMKRSPRSLRTGSKVPRVVVDRTRFHRRIIASGLSRTDGRSWRTPSRRGAERASRALAVANGRSSTTSAE